ncbi:uncharacterized membrane protein YhaH (DUF805 family) [Curtobacterium flaccumfaciens]|uniref:Uncharacterized membrane protein YhaH (DUF805 family) n=1 Tax=Curtobacterium flaccumfaciens TaxID=2035 RepID=A0A4R6DQA0_9MICO|nr:contact-dependent growth inhibition system immunity protein [Curtobacterium flaccumfaciens]TDN46629.1 uncharacterized membrane protein YhaH (DUF805 family) [Curtobacterium flaccumfaciens]
MARFTVDDSTVRSLARAAIHTEQARFDAWSNRGMLKPLRLTYRPERRGAVGVGTPLGEEIDLDTVRVILKASTGDPWQHTVRAVYPSLDVGAGAQFPALDDFVGAYFNRTWTDGDLSPIEAMAHFSAHARLTEVEALAIDIRAVLELDDEAIAARLVALDCNYDPADDNSTDRSWLEWVLRNLERDAVALAPVPSAVVGEAGWVRDSRPIRGADPVVAVKRFVVNAVSVDGRASRGEFWWARFLWGLVCVMLCGLFSAVPYEIRPPVMIGLLVWIAVTAIPNITLQVRRLHDTGRSGWSMLVQLAPVVGPFLLLVWNAQDSDRSGVRFDRPGEVRH